MVHAQMCLEAARSSIPPREGSSTGWEDGMDRANLSCLTRTADTTMVYLDITTEDEAKALATLEGKGIQKVEKKWKNSDGSFVNSVACLQKKIIKISKPFLFCMACKSGKIQKKV